MLEVAEPVADIGKIILKLIFKIISRSRFFNDLRSRS
jgi:hypothetical protein